MRRHVESARDVRGLQVGELRLGGDGAIPRLHILISRLQEPAAANGLALFFDHYAAFRADLRETGRAAIQAFTSASLHARALGVIRTPGGKP